MVVGADIEDSRLAQASTFGATHSIRLPAGRDQLLEQVRTHTAGRGADLAIELSGSTLGTSLTLESLRVGGTAIWQGAVLPIAPLTIAPEQIVRKCLRMQGVHNYAMEDLIAAIAFLTTHHQQFPFGELVAEIYPLTQIDEAFAIPNTQRPVRIGLVP